MLKRQYRLNRKEYITREKGDVFNTPFFRFYAYKSETPKFGVITSKKSLKLSAERHLLKRRLCYAYNNSKLKELKAKIIVNTNFKDKKVPSYKIIKEEIQNLEKQLCGKQ